MRTRKNNPAHLMLIFLTLLAFMIISVCTTSIFLPKGKIQLIHVVKIIEPNLVIFVPLDSIANAPDTVISTTKLIPSTNTSLKAIIRDGKLEHWQEIR